MHRPPKTKLIAALGGVLLALSASFSQAAGLGKLTVTSALGQPLSAEIELVSLQPGEFEAIAARVASPESYGEARIEYSPSLRQVRFVTARRTDGKPILRITSIAPVNEPFLDVLVEVTWPTGRLLREYPILLDPPGFAETRVAPAVPAATPVAPVPAEPAATVEAPLPTATAIPVPDAITPTPIPAPTSDAVTPVPAPGVISGTPPPVPETGAGPSAKAEASAESYGPVKRGDTLNKIASEMKPDTVSLEQMLVALYRENKTAFISNNMNRLKTGQILRVPSAEAVGKISQGEARKEIKVQVADWKAYREQLAGAAASGAEKPSAASNESSGKIAVAKPDKPVPAATSTDQLKIAKMDGATGKAGGAGAKGGPQDQLNALKEEAIARENQLKEANSRVTDLEKQIKDMRKLMELKATPPVPIKPADAKVAPPPVAPPKVAEPAKTAPAPEAKGTPAAAKTVEPVKPAGVKTPDVLVADGKPVGSAKPAEAKPAETKPADGKAVNVKPAAPKAPVSVTPSPSEPSILDMIQDNAILIGTAISVLGFGGLIAFMMRRKKKPDGGATSQLMNTSSIMPSDLKPNTVTGNRAGGLVDTGNSSFLTDFDKTGPGSIDTDEVDPVAEAEVYIAYGRDAQAEEILKEAMTRDKSRHEIALKLLEIYHARKSAQAFETVARELKDSIGTNHPIWAKAAAMGSSIDPGNSLYGGVGQAYAATGAYAAGVPTMVADRADERAVTPPDLDFDLGFSDSAASPTAASRPIDITSANTDQPAGASMDFDLDLNSSSPALPTPAAKTGGLDFDLASDVHAGSAAPVAQEVPESTGFDFDLSALSLDTPAMAPKVDVAPAASPVTVSAPSMSLSDLSLDLDGPADSGAAGASAVATKLELAKAYIEIGDSDGAKEILTEVAREGSAAQQDEAKKILAGL